MKKISDSKRSELLLKMGLLLALTIGFGIYSNLDSLRWYFVDWKTFHQMNGQIISSNIEAGGTYGGWRFNITYGYKVENEKFISNRVHFGYQAMDDPSYAKSYVEKYPIGKKVVVFYDKNHPENSVLEPQVIWNGLLDFYLIIALLPITIFGLATYFYTKSRCQ